MSSAAPTITETIEVAAIASEQRGSDTIWSVKGTDDRLYGTKREEVIEEVKRCQGSRYVVITYEERERPGKSGKTWLNRYIDSIRAADGAEIREMLGEGTPAAQAPTSAQPGSTSDAGAREQAIQRQTALGLSLRYLELRREERVDLALVRGIADEFLAYVRGESPAPAEAAAPARSDDPDDDVPPEYEEFELQDPASSLPEDWS